MPGHASAANRAYPEFSGGGSKDHPEFTFNIAKDETYAYLSAILGEVSELFPSKYIHIGGDEVSFGNQQWVSNPDFQQLMEEHQLKNSQEVEHYFINRIKDTLNRLGKTLVGWDEIASAKVPAKNTLLMWWRHDKPEILQNAIKEGYPLILCPRVPLYFDFIQHEEHHNGRKWDGDFGTLQDVYEFPKALGVDLSNATILGLQANLWTEQVDTEKDVDYKTWPRLCALAETSWSAEDSKNYEAFLLRLNQHYSIFKSQKLYYF